MGKRPGSKKLIFFLKMCNSGTPYLACLVFPLFYRLRDDRAKVQNYWEDVVPQYDESQFRRTFRLPRSVFSHVLDNISDDLTSEHVAGRR